MKHHLAEVRAAAALAEEHHVAREDLDAISGRIRELQQMVRWCKTAGREVRGFRSRQPPCLPPTPPMSLATCGRAY